MPVQKTNDAAFESQQSRFYPAVAKLTIASIDDPKIRVVAQYNPKELTLTQPVTWSTTTPAHHDNLGLTFGGVQPTTLQVELLFDGFEDKASVQDRIEQIKHLAAVRVPGSKDEDLARPHACLIVWGQKGMPRMSCVIESVATKYLMFGSDGAALRATCTVNLKEAHAVGRREIKQDFSWADDLATARAGGPVR